MSTAMRALVSLLIGVVVATIMCLFAGFRYAYVYVFAAFPALLTVLPTRATRTRRNRRAP